MEGQCISLQIIYLRVGQWHINNMIMVSSLAMANVYNMFIIILLV